MVHHFAFIMKKFQNSELLIGRIKKFNEIFLIDLENSSNEKKWVDYLDPISNNLFNQTYLEFIQENSLVFPNPPGEMEKYYNFFKTIENDFKDLAVLDVPNEIYCSAMDVLDSFDKFLDVNNFNVVNEKNVVNGLFVYSYKIFPLI